jgi:hypothetical protein
MKNGFERGFNLGDMPFVRRGLLCPDCVIDFDVPEGTVVGDIMNYKSKTDRIMTKEEHAKLVEKLNELESELVDLIAATGDVKLMNKFTEWCEQRSKCNEGYLEFLDGLIKTK